MAGNNLSPRQKMIGMMYLVLTALLALNVSKEVLNAFQNVNGGIERTTDNFSSKNDEVYSQFTRAYETNPAKAGPWKDRAFSVRSKSDSIVEFIKELKYNIVLLTDNQVTFSGFENEPVEFSYDQLPAKYKNLSITNILKKSDRYKSGEIMIKSPNGEKVKSLLSNYRNYLLTLTQNNISIKNSLNKAFDLSDVKLSGRKVKTQSWVEYNFNDMPVIAAVTLLSKIQADVRNAESDVIKHLQKEIDAGSLKFTSVEAIQIAPSNYVFVGDSFKADVFLAAKDSTQDPVIFVGDYEIDENGFYQMIGKYDSIPVKGGKGKFAIKTRKQGYQKWGGLIGMQTDEGVKMYPFSGEFQVAAQSFVVSPTKMNVLYILAKHPLMENAMGNPIDVSVPGVSKDKIRVSCNNGVIKKVGNSWEVFPKRPGKAKINVSAEIQGKFRTMGFMDFRVKITPTPKQKLIGSKNGKIKKSVIMSNKCKVIASQKDFDFDIKNTVKSFKMNFISNGVSVPFDQPNGNKLTDAMRNFIKNTPVPITTYITSFSKGPYGNVEDLGTEMITIN